MSEPENATPLDATTLPLCTDAFTLFDHMSLHGFRSWPEMTGGREWPYAGLCANENAGDTFPIMTQLAAYFGLDLFDEDDVPRRPARDLCLRIARSGRAWLELDGRALVDMNEEGFFEWHHCALDTGCVLLLVAFSPVPDDVGLYEFFHDMCTLENTAAAMIPVKPARLSVQRGFTYSATSAVSGFVDRVAASVNMSETWSGCQAWDGEHVRDMVRLPGVGR